MKFKREAIEYAEKNSTAIIKLQKNFMLLLNGLENGGKTNWKYLNQQLNQRIKDWKVVGENQQAYY